MAVMAVIALGSSATLAQPGPNGSNNFGLCTAYFSGSENGQNNKRKAPPFAELERVAEEDYDEEFGENDASIQDKVAWWCSQNAPHPSTNGGGNGGNGGAEAGAASSGKRGR